MASERRRGVVRVPKRAPRRAAIPPIHVSYIERCSFESWPSGADDSNGTSVLISRTDPLVDPVLENGVIGAPEQKLEWIKAQVYSGTPGFIRIHTEVPIDGFAHGRWR